MKKVLLLTLCFSFIIGAVFANPAKPDNTKKPVYTPIVQKITAPSRDEVPTYTMATPPIEIIDNYYDYQIGAYNHLPIQVIPDEAGGGYFLTYHGKVTLESTRRVFWAHIAADGTVQTNEISNTTNHEGYPTLGVDPISGIPMYAWHANHDTDTELEVQFVWDSFIGNAPGSWNTIIPVMNNPLEVGVTDDNEFIWPTIKIGPSPNANMRRVYVLARNSISHALNGDPSENCIIGYADFTTEGMMMGNNLTWTYITIPELDAWNTDELNFRRPNYTLAVDNLGNIYYYGHHIARATDGSIIMEPDMDVFICPNYGQGTWTRVSAMGRMNAWNPPVPPNNEGYFINSETNLPYADGELFFSFNSSHQNAVIDNLGRIHSPGLFALSTIELTYYPYMQNLKNIVYDTNTQEFLIQDIFPKLPVGDTFNEHYIPWDIEAPFGEVDEIVYQESDDTYHPTIEVNMPLPHMDADLHSDAAGNMDFHYNNQKLTEVNEQGMMVMVWQDSQRARNGFNWPEDYPEDVPYTTGPEIMIVTSKDNGTTWSDPMRLNAVDTPELAGMIPMWVYPADKVKYMGQTETGDPIGRVGFMFLDDNTWGAYPIEPDIFPANDGGTVMFMELDIVFPGSDSNDPVVPVVSNILNQNYPNPFNPETTISFDMPKNGNARLDVFNVKGQLVNTLYNGTATRGKNTVVWNGTDSRGNNVTSGLYFYRLSTDNHSETRKMMLMK
ncbi:MAG: T9SS type A sorting domain-containing protein [Candidatus Cloacimonetes bacterium]|jgi:hypothetical protein|nr:T9SS type A sorting domain-containing protein [Candidatus Cloacimonadota bacterium]MDD4147224.1 T9SS type A sorting domain-containing protein [Candidatus Cloacimonadota bacterium]MDD4559376.1 T9SS type A sorting domain-containing protein [Candidatus Cloacimonadota bacterium]